ncbi:hypothetical protein KBB12_03565 [Candidatus Woesebacteria bacterium]|nr:hypothetical protein [Candidatus Woesebacteria bacterium]
MLEHRTANHTEMRQQTEFLVGVSMEPVLAVPKMDVVGDRATQYEARTYSSGGAVVVSQQNPAEAAVNATLRRGADVVELGPYSGDHFDLVAKMYEPHDHVTVNGRRQSVRRHGAIRSVGAMARAKGITRMVTHEVDPRLKDIAERMGLALRENPELCRTLGTKSGLNTAIAGYRETHSNTSLVPFGTNIHDLDATMAEVAKLESVGKGTYIKLDTVRGGIVAAGGEGHLALPFGTSQDEARNRILAMTGGDTQFMGVVQMQLNGYRVLSLSSGQDRSGQFVAYEAHEQTVDGNTADGAMPITDPWMRTEFRKFWADVREFYGHYGVTGDQNLNAMVLTLEDYAVACALYGEQNVARMVFVDFNYRAISGTKNAMARLQEDTGKPMDHGVDFRSRGIRVGAGFAANPHLMFAAGKSMGLHPGKGGNFTVVNMGTFTPNAVAGFPYLKTQVIANCDNASGCVDAYEAALMESSPRALANAMGMPYVEPAQVPHMPKVQYQQIVHNGMDRVLNLSTGRYEESKHQTFRGNIWAGR